MKYPWDQLDRLIMRQDLERGALSALAREHNIPVSAVTTRRWKLRLERSRAAYSKWTAAEEDYLAEHLAVDPVPAIARHLGRSGMAVFQRALMLGLLEECDTDISLGNPPKRVA